MPPQNIGRHEASRRILPLVFPAVFLAGRSFDLACGLAQDDTVRGEGLELASLCFPPAGEAPAKRVVREKLRPEHTLTPPRSARNDKFSVRRSTRDDLKYKSAMGESTSSPDADSPIAFCVNLSRSAPVYVVPNSELSYSSRFLYSAMESGQLSRKIPRLAGIRAQPGSAICAVGFTGFCPEPNSTAAAHTTPTSTK